MTASVLAVLTPTGPQLRDAAAPLVPAEDLGLLRGEAVFETLRIAAGGPAFVAEHLSRLVRSAARLQVVLPDGLAELVRTAAAAWPAADGVLRVVVTKGVPPAQGTAFALVSPLPAQSVADRDGVSAVVLDLGVPAGLRARAPWLLGGVKATSYAVNMAALREARARAADDAVFASSDGEVLEGPTSTCAWFDARGALVTPPPDEVAILAGTTMAVTLACAHGLGMAVQVRRGTVRELRAATEVALLGSVRGVAPVLRLDGVPVGDGRPGPRTRRLQAAFEDALADSGRKAHDSASHRT